MFGNTQKDAPFAGLFKSSTQSSDNQQTTLVGGFSQGQSKENAKEVYHHHQQQQQPICEPYSKHQIYESYWKPKIPKKKMTPVKKLKVLIIGDGAVGKNSFVQNLLAKEFSMKYNMTSGADIRSLDMLTNYGLFTFEVFDIAGQEKFGATNDDYYNGADCAILMFDLTWEQSYKSLMYHWSRKISNICGDIPRILVGNKAENVQNRKIDYKAITFHKEKIKMPYCEISAKTGYQCERPLLLLLRMMANNNTIELLGEPVIQPEEPTRLTEEEILSAIKEGENAEDTPLPENNDKEFEIFFSRKR